MDEKNHSNERLHLKELGEEDRYIGERDRVALASLKAYQTEEQERLVREQSLGCCPQCGAPLQTRTVSGVTILECLSCQGIWLNKDKIPTITHFGSGPWFETFLRSLGWWRPFHCD